MSGMTFDHLSGIRRRDNEGGKSVMLVLYTRFTSLVLLHWFYIFVATVEIVEFVVVFIAVAAVAVVIVDSFFVVGGGIGGGDFCDLFMSLVCCYLLYDFHFVLFFLSYSL